MTRWLVVTALFVVACGADDAKQPTQQPDAGALLDAASEDLGLPDIGSDSGFDDSGNAPSNANWVSVKLLDGTEVEGEIIATYELIRWWQGGEGLLYAIFDPHKFADYPNDLSLRFVPSTEVVSIDLTTPIPVPMTYREFLRNRDIFIQRPPFDDTSFVLTGNDSYHLEEDGFGDYAWDFEITDAAGKRFTGDGKNNVDYFVWNEPVLSGVTGEVIDVVSTSVDNTPGEHPPTSEAVNNWVGIALGGSFYVYYLHFQEDGIDPSVRVGSWVQTGDVLGVAGNSGVTLEPHIHVVLLWYDVAAGRSYSVPISFETVDVSRTPIGPFEPKAEWKPTTGEWLRDTL